VKKIIAKELALSASGVPGRPWPASSLLPQRWLNDDQKQAYKKLAE